MMAFFTLCSLIFVVGYCSAKLTPVPNCGKSRELGRIVNGTVTKPGAYPWMVSIHQNVNGTWKHICGGSVLNENWIITAAHCIDQPIVTEDYVVYTGIYSILKKEGPTVQKLELSNILLHEKYSNETEVYDVALLETKTKINISGSDGYINAICLPEKNVYPTGEATVIGWGKLSDNGSLSAELREAVVPIVPRENCSKKYEDENSEFNYVQIVSHMICAGGEGKDSCQYDSGGPLFQTNQKTGVSTLIGVVSGGADCAFEDYPGIYMKVGAFRTWIGNHTT